MHDLSFWLLLAAAPGTVMLVALGIHYRSNSRIDAKAIPPFEPLVEMEFDGMGPFTRNTIEETGAQTNLPVLGSEATRNVALDKDLAELVANMREMATLTARLNDKKQSLEHTTLPPVLAADNTRPNRCYLSFTLRDQPFAVSTSSVCGVIEATQLITRPNLPTKLRRAIKLRGALVPVIDLGVYLGGQPIKIGRSTNIVILEVTIDEGMQTIGVVVDAVGKVEEIPPREIEPREAFDSKVHNDFTLGTITVNNHTLTLLDIGRGLLANEFVVLRSTARSQTQENTSRG
jgi:purine-binding chemotaxis protein CheW